MCESCNIQTYASKQNQYDPTRTTSLRNIFAKNMKRRFDELEKVIVTSVVDNDCFGLSELVTQQMTPAGRRAFNYTLNREKIEAFLNWLEEQSRLGILEVRYMPGSLNTIEQSWMNLYITDSYKRGLIRARIEMKRAGLNVPSIEDTGGINASMSLPIHVDRLGLLFLRAFEELKNVTAAMSLQISKVLAQGLADGDGPRLLARKLVSTINGSGMGDLGITDSLGRFIPAKRRADMIARTETIRAHHHANINEYKSWGLEGIKVLSEFRSAGDDRVCFECSSLHGKIFTLDEAYDIIPVHPNCFTDQQTPIYTSKGWKQIGKIEVGDLVLTHRKRFRKVTQLIRTKNQKPEVIKLHLKGYKTFSVTANHPILVITENGGNQWKEAGEVKQTDLISFLGNECKRCGEKIPYFRTYCSRSCWSKDVTDKQWSNPEHRKNVSEKNSISMLNQYQSGERDRFEITKKANDKARQLGKDGEHHSQREENRNRMRDVGNTPELREKSSKRMKENNPMNDPMVREKATNSLLKFYNDFPEKRLNARMAKHRKSGRKTGIEQRMADLLDKLGVHYVFQYPILNYNADFAIPGLKIVIECDGEYWHKDKKKDDIRQARIEKEGWFVLRFDDMRINQCIDEIEGELLRVVSNHTGEYCLAPIQIMKIEKFTCKQARTLYNFSVEEDESYIAKGVVVHNCRCICLPHSEKLKKILNDE